MGTISSTDTMFGSVKINKLSLVKYLVEIEKNALMNVLEMIGVGRTTFAAKTARKLSVI